MRELISCGTLQKNNTQYASIVWNLEKSEVSITYSWHMSKTSIGKKIFILPISNIFVDIFLFVVRPVDLKLEFVVFLRSCCKCWVLALTTTKNERWLTSPGVTRDTKRPIFKAILIIVVNYGRKGVLRKSSWKKTHVSYRQKRNELSAGYNKSLPTTSNLIKGSRVFMNEDNVHNR